MSQPIKYISPIVLAGLVLLAFFPLSNIGAGLTLTQDNLFGTNGCAIIAGGIDPAGFPPACSVTVTFSKPFPKPPIVAILNTSIAPITGFETDFSVVAPGPTDATWTAMPAAVTEIFGNTKHQFVYTGAESNNPACLLWANVVNPGFAGSRLRLQSSTDDVNWGNAWPGNEAITDIPINSAGIQFSTQTFGYVIGAQGPFFRVVGIGGNGVVSPSFASVTVICEPSIDSRILQVSVETITTTNFILLIDFFEHQESGGSATVTWEACTVC